MKFSLLVAIVSAQDSKYFTPAKFEITMALKDDPNTTCSDGSSCPGDDTCCPIGGGLFGCCGFSNAVCCDEYCCPAGYTCDVAPCTKPPNHIWGPFGIEEMQALQ